MKKSPVEKLAKEIYKFYRNQLETLGMDGFAKKYPAMHDEIVRMSSEMKDDEVVVIDEFPEELKALSREELLDWLRRKYDGRLS